MQPLEPVRFESGRPMFLGGLRQSHSFEAASQGILAQWQQFLAQEPLSGQQGTTLYGVMCGSSPTGLEYMCAVEVESLPALPEGVGRMRILPQTYAVFRHEGPSSTLHLTWGRIIREWLPRGAYVSAHKPDFEVYPQPEAVSAANGVEIWVAVLPVEQSSPSSQP